MANYKQGVQERPLLSKQQAFKNTLYASFGGILEFYDFILFVFFTSIFAQIFFPPNNEFWAQLGVWISFGAGYLARPFGALIFAHFGDIKGRKPVFYISMLFMIIPSFILAFLPTYDSIGLFATVTLFLIRIVQGLAVGAEVSGAWVFVSELVSAKYKSLALSFISATLTVGLLLAALISLFINIYFTQEEIKEYAWRIPFLIGAVFGLGACFLRSRLVESPVFLRLVNEDKRLKFPLLQALKTHKKAMLVCVLMSVVLSSGIATLTIIPKHFDSLFAFSETQKILYTNLASLCIILGSLTQGILATFLGNYKICFIFSLLFAFFGILLGFYDDNFLLYYLCACFSQGIISFAPIFMTKVFSAELKFSGLAFAYNLSYCILVFFTPFVVNAIYEDKIAYYMLFVSISSLLCIALVRHLDKV